jgi:hypothetical protein
LFPLLLRQAYIKLRMTEFPAIAAVVLSLDETPCCGAISGRDMEMLAKTGADDHANVEIETPAADFGLCARSKKRSGNRPHQKVEETL